MRTTLKEAGMIARMQGKVVVMRNLPPQPRNGIRAGRRDVRVVSSEDMPSGYYKIDVAPKKLNNDRKASK